MIMIMCKHKRNQKSGRRYYIAVFLCAFEHVFKYRIVYFLFRVNNQDI